MAKTRKRNYDYGWWQTQRDRFNLPNAPPPAPFSVKSMANVLPHVLEDLDMKQEAWLCEIGAEWEDLVGPQIASHARPGRLDNRILYVYVEHSIWLNELSRYGQKQMLSRLQRTFGKERILTIKLQLDPDGSGRQ